MDMGLHTVMMGAVIPMIMVSRQMDMGRKPLHGKKGRDQTEKQNPIVTTVDHTGPKNPTVMEYSATKQPPPGKTLWPDG